MTIFNQLFQGLYKLEAEHSLSWVVRKKDDGVATKYLTENQTIIGFHLVSVRLVPSEVVVILCSILRTLKTLQLVQLEAGSSSLE